MNRIKYLLGRAKYHWNMRNKPLTVHTESIFLDEVWEKVKEKVLNKEIYRWYVMAPENYEYFKANFNCKLSKEKLSNLMNERYLWMIKHRQNLQLHVHLSRLMNISYKEQENLIKESKEWFERELKIIPKEIVFGWWEFNEDSLEIIKKMNLKHIKKEYFNATHDYNFIQEERKSYNQDLILKVAIKKYCKDKKVLDLGCGNLEYSRFIKDSGAKEVYAVDIKEPKEKILGIKFLEEDAQKTSFKDNSFDVIFCKGLIEYINLKKGIEEIKRLIKPNGIILFQTKDSRGIRHKFASFKKILGRKTLVGQPQTFNKLLKKLKENFSVLEFYETKPRHNVFWALQR